MDKILLFESNARHHNCNSQSLNPKEDAIPPSVLSHQVMVILVRMEKLSTQRNSIMPDDKLEQVMREHRLTPCWWFSPIGTNRNSSTPPILRAILYPVRPAPAAAKATSVY
jgi:hypothetical protein